jgi:hypothetical protein
MNHHFFSFNSRLGISIPDLQKPWYDYSDKDQQEIILTWETIRGRIPDRIGELETLINSKQAELNDENDFPRSCLLNSEISELASVINDLWLWYRTNQNVSTKVHL